MTEALLRERCTVLAGGGDEQARATLDALKELDERRAATPQPKKLQETAGELKQLSYAKYILKKLAITLSAAENLNVISHEDGHDAMTVDIISVIVQRCRRTGSTQLRGPALCDFVAKIVEEVGSRGLYIEFLKSLLRGLGLNPPDAVPPDFNPAVTAAASDPEAQAILATRKANGLTPGTDPAVTRPNTDVPAGQYTKGSGI